MFRIKNEQNVVHRSLNFHSAILDREITFALANTSDQANTRICSLPYVDVTGSRPSQFHSFYVDFSFFLAEAAFEAEQELSRRLSGWSTTSQSTSPVLTSTALLHSAERTTSPAIETTELSRVGMSTQNRSHFQLFSL